ncbi:uncharacterized protein [Physcomitrium patens]|uniref:Ubiquitin-like protease family profile domain-containing protein n=1 Tax=Physcomitrium patens TaxID=3218 RepID=A0A2K1K1Z5_PHYPA|nr:ubiquitin-like-specific protease 1D [Physcomitrium patens]PNR47804.1 hypothetical protein PHYPA_012277 [Physcomitrium patens]|eukprot:XP_024384389.1 ubiquitin-like-specific protease 1D [Physcomitrella patens]
MIGLHHSVISDDSEDVSDGVEVEFFTDSKAQKFKEFSDTQLDDEIEKYEGYVAGTRKAALNLPDGGNKFTKHLESLRSEKHKRARKLKRALAVGTQKLRDIGYLSNLGNGNGGTRWETKSAAQSVSTKPQNTRSTIKVENVSTDISANGFVSREASKSVDYNNGKSIVIIRRSPSPEEKASSSEGATLVLSGEQSGPSSRELLTPKTPDPSFQVDSDRKRLVAEPIGRSRKRAREAEFVGRTPDTAMEIDSSDEEDKTSVGNRSSFDGSCVEVSRRAGLRNTFRRRMEKLKVKIAYPSRTDPDAVEILPSDLTRLEPLEFLNDTIIDFYIKYIQRDEFLGAEGRQRFHFFNSFFYKKLSEVVNSQKKKGEAYFSKLRKWTKGTNIFEKDYLFVPIHDKLHWSLAIICFPGFDKGGQSERCIIHLDSMTHGHDSQRVFRLLRSYIVAEWKHSVETCENEADECTLSVQRLKADEIMCKKVPVPLQDNESDCGLFLLHYIQKFVEYAPKTLKSRDLDGNWENLGVFGRDWFLSTEASSLRTSILEHLCRLFKQEYSILEQANNPVIPLDGEAT